MTAPRPPSLEEIEEDLAAAPHADPVFSSALTDDKTGQESEDSLSVMEFIYMYHCLYRKGRRGG